MEDAATPAAAAELRDTVEALRAEWGRNAAPVFWLATAAVVAALLALPLVHVTDTVRAQGFVRPTEAPVELRAPVSGLVGAVLVRDNEFVAAGQPLLEYGSPYRSTLQLAPATPRKAYRRHKPFCSKRLHSLRP